MLNLVSSSKCHRLGFADVDTDFIHLKPVVYIGKMNLKQYFQHQFWCSLYKSQCHQHKV